MSAEPQRPDREETEDRADRERVSRFLANREEAAFRELYREHTPYLFHLALRMLGGRHPEAEDALQEAWLRAARGLSGFRWGCRLRTWLGGIVVNCCRESRRRASRRELEPLVPTLSHPSGLAALDLERALRSLPDGLREVLVLHAIEGYTHEEIGGLLGIAAGTSKSRVFDARALLRQRRATKGAAS